VTTEPQPVVPAYGQGALTDVVAGIAGRVHGAVEGAARFAPACLDSARQVVLLIVDGLGWRQLEDRPSIAPTITSGEGSSITSVAPSTTAVALTSLSTGAPPARHGVVGYRMALDGSIFNALRWQWHGRDARRVVPAPELQPLPGFAFDGCGAPVVTKGEFVSSGFSAAFLAGCPMVPAHTTSGIVVGVRRLLRAGERFVVAYYDGLDLTAHLSGLGEHYDAELGAIDGLVGDLLAELVPGSALALTADHGQVQVGHDVSLLGPDVMEAVAFVSGEGRFRWLHARPGAADALLAASCEQFGARAWVRTREQVIEDGWLGGRPAPAVADRLGDVALVAFEACAFVDPADTGEQRLAARHGSLTADEMLVPFLGWRGEG
jgi:predicted AlkP superfamily pyrophosphatase or phosphodiesterase